jgi:D-glycero-D-manno-heptose 1,7-bisphosphate phosphatase
MAEPATSRLVVLDRDGVINEDSDAYIKSPEEWQPVPGSIEAIARLCQAGFQIAVATNQSGLARGYFDEVTLANIHNLMLDLVEQAGGSIATICYCPHHPNDACDCRKPLPGLLNAIEAELDLSVAGAWYVGDTLKDVQAARAKHCQPILVRSGKGRATEAALSDSERAALPIVDDLAAAAAYILAHSTPDDRNYVGDASA